MIDPKGLLFGILGRSPVNFWSGTIFHMIGFGTESDFQKEKNCDTPEVGFRGKPTFQKEKSRHLKKIDSVKNVRGQFSVRNVRYFINYSARENFITEIQYIWRFLICCFVRTPPLATWLWAPGPRPQVPGECRWAPWSPLVPGDNRRAPWSPAIAAGALGPRR